MYSICYLLIVFIAFAFAAPAANEEVKKPIEIIESSQEKKEDGSYNFHYRGEDGSFREETAVVHNQGTEDEYLEVNGSYSYFDVDGKEVVVHYKADPHGFLPEGNNISQQISEGAKQVSEQNAKSELRNELMPPMKG